MDNMSGYSQVVFETDSEGNITKEYVRGDSLTEIKVKTTDEGYSSGTYIVDGHGDVRLLLDEQGNITDSYRYTAYGEIKEKSGQTDNPYLYCGEYYDENTSLYYLRARYMNPSTGTFISMDSYQGNKYDPASLHKYTYAQNNPMMYNDPSGHFVNMISYVASTVIQNTISNSHTIFVMGVLSGITNVIINEVLGTGRDIADAFTEGFINGVVGALVFSAIAAIAAFYEISIFVIMYFGAAFDFAKNLCFAIAAYSTNKTECIMYAVLAVLDIITMWTSVRQINIIGEKGTTEVHIKRNATMSTDGDVGVETRVVVMRMFITIHVQMK